MQSCSELNEFMPILTATNGLAYFVLKGQLSCHKGTAVCQDTGALGGQGYRGLAGQGYREASWAGLQGASWAGLQGLAGQGYRWASWAGLQGAAGQDYRGG